ncbi:MAG: hypothetical protein IJ068_04650 [Bacilli bacterium]|nr:hypothetical protein [Bacilli bacterium]
MENSKNNKKIIIFLMIFIACLIIINFICAYPKYEITVEIIVCLSLLTILSLSEMFDDLSIPKVISLSKNVKEIKKENNDLKDTNIKLLTQIASIKNSNSQNIFLPNSFSTVSSSNIDDINKNDDKIESEESDVQSNLENKDYKDYRTRHKYRNNLDVFMLKKVLEFSNDIPNCDIRYDVKLINDKIRDDNIMNNEVRFDALKSTPNENIFYEVKIIPYLFDFSYQLHYMLRTIELYKDYSKIPCKLVLVLPKFEKELEKILFNTSRDRFSMIKDRISNRFDPAIKNHLLEIVEVDVSKEELDNYIKEKEESK